MSLLSLDRRTVEQIVSCPRGRELIGRWSDLVVELHRCANAMRAAGDDRQADALEHDAANMERRARLHLRALVNCRSEPATTT